jgi:hypothetical protein
VSVLCIHSGVRRYSYVAAQSFEHERAWSWIEAGPAEKLNLMHCVAVQESAELARVRLALGSGVHPLRTFAEKALEKLGVHPHTTQRVFEGVGKGEGVRNFRRFTSQPPELPLNAHLPAGSDAANDFLGRGWHAAEPHGRWSAGIAEIFFSVPARQDSTGTLVLELCGHVLHAGEKVTFTLNGGSPLTRTIGGADEVTTMQLPGPGRYCLTIAVETPIRPQSVGRSEDRRILGYCLAWLRLTSAPAKAEIPSPALSL